MQLIKGSGHDLDDTWQDDALCASVDARVFFEAEPHEARLICSACPVRAACLHCALERGERFGIWGGTTEVERRRLGPAA